MDSFNPHFRSQHVDSLPHVAFLYAWYGGPFFIFSTLFSSPQGPKKILPVNAPLGATGSRTDWEHFDHQIAA